MAFAGYRPIACLVCEIQEIQGQYKYYNPLSSANRYTVPGIIPGILFLNIDFHGNNNL